MAKERGVLSLNSGKCIYTGERATSADHVPPKSFLAHPLPVNLLTVPACGAFNSKSALDEQYFMTVIAHIGHHPALARRLVEGGDIDRALSRRPAFEERLLAEMSVDENGRPYLSPDQDRIDAILRKLAAGLYFLRCGRAPGLRAFKPISLYNLDDPPAEVAKLSWSFIRDEPMQVVQWSVFSYGFCKSELSADVSFCNLNFYNSVFALIECPPLLD